MLILGIESSTLAAGCAIGGHEGVLAMAQVGRGRRHAESLAPQVQFICAQAQVELSEISVIAVDVGPGLFTGLRVGIATAKAFAHALRDGERRVDDFGRVERAIHHRCIIVGSVSSVIPWRAALRSAAIR